LLTWITQRFVFQFGHDLSVEVYKRTLYQPYLYPRIEEYERNYCGSQQGRCRRRWNANEHNALDHRRHHLSVHHRGACGN
jgi:hypothetical protein